MFLGVLVAVAISVFGGFNYSCQAHQEKIGVNVCYTQEQIDSKVSSK